MEQELISPKIDFVFKEIMKNEKALKGFLCAILKLDPNAVQTITRVDPHTDRDFLDDKQGILDVRVKLVAAHTGPHEIDIEIQIAPHPSWTSRCLYYLSRMYVDQLKRGDSYDLLMKCVSIGILDFVCFPEIRDQYYSCFHIAEDRTQIRFSDNFEFHALELPKIPQDAMRVIWDDPIYQWARFFSAETRQEVNAVSQMNPSIEEAARELERINSDPILRDQALRRKLELMDEIAIIQGAEQRGATLANERSAVKLYRAGVAVPIIAEATSLSEERILQLAREANLPS